MNIEFSEVYLITSGVPTKGVGWDDVLALLAAANAVYHNGRSNRNTLEDGEFGW